MPDTKNVPGEGQIPLTQMLQVMPDVFTPQGLEMLNQKLTKAKQEQSNLDPIIKEIADQLNADHASRVKNHAVSLKKIAQKRIGGDDYGVDDINDSLGGRITLNDESQMPQAIQKIKDASQNGKFTLNKQEHIKDETHDSEHFDLTLPTGQQVELQLLPNQQDLANSIVGHDIYQTYGEDPPPQAKQVKNIQSKIVDSLPDKKAKKLSNTMLDLHKANSDIPLDPQITASIVANTKKNSDFTLPPIK